jgi:hypothetical protein
MKLRDGAKRSNGIITSETVKSPEAVTRPETIRESDGEAVPAASGTTDASKVSESLNGAVALNALVGENT